MNEKKEQEVLRLYEKYGDHRDISKRLKISHGSVIKVLVSNGIFPNDRSLEIKKLREAGLSADEIARECGIMIKTVNNYTPYKQRYDSETPTANALRIRALRKRKKAKVGDSVLDDSQ